MLARASRGQHWLPGCQCCEAEGNAATVGRSSIRRNDPIANHVRELRTSDRPGECIDGEGCRCSHSPRPLVGPTGSRPAGGFHEPSAAVRRDLLRGFFPEKSQVPDHGNHPQADASSRGNVKRAVESEVVDGVRVVRGSVRRSGSWW